MNVDKSLIDFSYKGKKNDLPNELVDKTTSVCETFADGTPHLSKGNDKNDFKTRNNKLNIFPVEDY